LLLGLIIAFHVACALLGKPIYRASYLGTALEYGRGSINLLRPTIVGWNATGTPTAQELPIWAAAAGALFKITGSEWYGWANVVSLFFFLAGIWPFFQLGREYVGERGAWWAIAFLIAQPVVIMLAGEASPTGSCLTAMLWFLFFVDRMIREGNGWWWWPAALAGSVLAISKLPFLMTAGLCGVFILLIHRTRSWKPWLLLAAAGAVAALIFFAWTRYADSLAAQAEYPYVELRLSQSPFMKFWYFGDLHYRLSPGHWIKGLWRFLHATLGTLSMTALLVVALVRRGNLLAKLWLVAMFLTTIVFTHLVLEHWHYYLMCSPAVAMLCGAMLVEWEELWSQQHLLRRCLTFALAGLALAGSAIDGLIAMKIALNYDYFPETMSRIVNLQTRANDKLVLYTCDPVWGGEILFRAGRKGLSVMALNGSPDGPSKKGLVDLITNQSDLLRLKSLGYNKLVLVSESPVFYAVQAANPGSKRKRVYYPKKITPTVDAWPVVYESEDLLIKDIP
jgi:hypothetical protein